MRKRSKLGLALLGLILALVLGPILFIEFNCRAPLPDFKRGDYKPLLAEADRRAEARTWLTYPEWHIVYSADSLGRYLMSGGRPSGYRYGDDIKGFWLGYCALNRVTQDDAGDAKVMIYTIGISYTAELVIKAVYEKTIGWLSEALGGWGSADDRYAARVQTLYGSFMHETPWYRFPFGQAFSSLWGISDPNHRGRHWERRFALSAEYGVKTLYAKAIGAASGAALGRDEPTLRFIAQATPGAVRAVDARLKPIETLKGGRVIVEAPRYASFSELLGKLARSRVKLVEIAGNDDIFVTLLVPEVKVASFKDQTKLLSMRLGERPGWRRIGLSVKVPELLPLIARAKRESVTVEHVYDY